MNELVQTKISALPAPISPTLERELRLVTNKLDPALHPGRLSYSISAEFAPSKELRQSLERRAHNIDRWMQPAGPERALAEFKILFDVMAHKDASGESADRITAAYVEALMDLPYFSLVEACTAFLKGAVGDGQWAPKPGEIRIEAQKRLAGLAKERREIKAVLTAQVLPPTTSPERKAKLLEVARHVVKDMRAAGLKAEYERAGKSFEPPPDPAEKTPEQHLAHAEEIGKLPIPLLSESTRKTLGLLRGLPVNEAAE